MSGIQRMQLSSERRQQSSDDLFEADLADDDPSRLIYATGS